MHNKKKSKYKNIKCTHNGIKFDSILEKNIYCYLKREIDKLKINEQISIDTHKRITLIPKTNTNRKVTYTCDIFITNKNKNKPLMLDVKSPATMTSTFLLKRKIASTVGINIIPIMSYNDAHKELYNYIGAL